MLADAWHLVGCVLQVRKTSVPVREDGGEAGAGADADSDWRSGAGTGGDAGT